MGENKPEWCPHKNCKFIASSQELICVGKLSKPEPHDNDFNTHGFCMNTENTGFGINDFQINWTDAWNMIRLLKLVKE